MRKLFSITSTTLVLLGGLHAEALELPALEKFGFSNHPDPGFCARHRRDRSRVVNTRRKRIAPDFGLPPFGSQRGCNGTAN